MEIRVNLEWSNEAERDLLGLFEHYSTVKALEYVDAIEDQAQEIRHYPKIGTVWKRGDYKLLISGTPFFLVYELLPSAKSPKIARILSLVDGRNFPVAKEYQHLL